MVWQTAKSNILRVVPIDLADGDYEDNDGFFIRSSGGGSITYCPYGNADNEAITKTLPASASFDDPEIIRKVFAVGSPLLTDLYAGTGV